MVQVSSGFRHFYPREREPREAMFFFQLSVPTMGKPRICLRPLLRKQLEICGSRLERPKEIGRFRPQNGSGTIQVKALQSNLNIYSGTSRDHVELALPMGKPHGSRNANTTFAKRGQEHKLVGRQAGERVVSLSLFLWPFGRHGVFLLDSPP